MNRLYLNHLKRQFLNAVGSNYGSINYKEFDEYLTKVNSLGYEYINILRNLGIDTNDSNIVEVNKGIVDSVAYVKTNFSLITPYTDDMTDSYGNEIYRFKFIGKDGIPLLKTNSGVIHNLSSIAPLKHIFITQNPYNYEMIEGFSKLSQTGYYKTVFGMYGMIYDKDYYDKIKLFERVRNEINNDYTEIITNNDSYYLIVNSNVKVKTKSR